MFVIETATVWATSALALMVLIISVYFSIFFMIFYAVAWALTVPLKKIAKIIYG